MRVFLSDTEHLLRDVLKEFLARRAGLEVVGDTADGIETLELVESLEPDVLVLDLVLRGPADGIEVMKRLREGSSDVRIVVLSALAGSAHVAQALQAGADAYVSKRAPGAELLNAIEAVSGGGHYLSQDVHCRLGSFEEASQMTIEDPFRGLTPRERELFMLIAQGLEPRQIARILGISPKTVDVHRLSIGSKLGLKTALDFHRFAEEHGPI